MAFLLSLCFVFGVARLRAEEPSLPRGTLAPDFALPDTNGQQVRLETYRGRPIVLNFWAFWCDTWKAELPHLKELAARRDGLNFALVAVSVDGTRMHTFTNYTNGGKLPFPVLLDLGGKVTEKYRVGHVPTVVILDGNGVIRYTSITYPGNDVMLRELRKLDSGAGYVPSQNVPTFLPVSSLPKRTASATKGRIRIGASIQQGANRAKRQR